MEKIAEKSCEYELIPIFWWQFFDHLMPDIQIKHKIKETAIKGNIWVPFYTPKVGDSGGG